MKVRNHLIVNFADMHVQENTALINTFWQFMKERNHLNVKFVDMQLLINKTLTDTFGQSMKERNPFECELREYASAAK